MALTPSQRKANDKYIKEHYTQVKLSMPNEEAEQLEQFCRKHDYTKAGFIRQAIKEKMNQFNDHISITIPKGRKKAVEAYAREQGESVNGYVNGLIRGDMGLSEDEWKQGQTED